MAITYTMTESLTRNGATFTKSRDIATGDAEWVAEHTVPDSTTDQQVIVALDVSAIKCIVINSTKALTIETNNSSVPDETLALVADVPTVWYTNKYHAKDFAVDITTLYLTNASGASATVNFFVLYDSTP